MFYIATKCVFAYHVITSCIESYTFNYSKFKGTNMYASQNCVIHVVFRMKGITYTI